MISASAPFDTPMSSNAMVMVSSSADAPAYLFTIYARLIHQLLLPIPYMEHTYFMLLLASFTDPGLRTPGYGDTEVEVFILPVPSKS